MGSSGVQMGRTSSIVVLFTDQSNLILEEAERRNYHRTEERWLRLVKASLVDVRDDNIERWARSLGATYSISRSNLEVAEQLLPSQLIFV